MALPKAILSETRRSARRRPARGLDRRGDEAADVNGLLIRAQEDERRRIARELHDDVNQRVALFAIELAQLAEGIPSGRSAVRLRLLELRTRAEEVSVALHRLSHQLHPSTLDHLGLVAAVRGYCEETARWHGLEIDLACGDMPAVVRKDAALCLFRIVQEAIRNVIRHSGAARACVALWEEGGRLRLTVSDAGVGFDANAIDAKRGLGIVSMCERVRLVGGEIDIRSTPGRGTCVDVRLPTEEHI
jgi:signal transduction histidine kinase